MNKSEFMSILQARLADVNPSWKDELLNDLEEHFMQASSDGISEEEVVRHLGDPMELAQQFYEEAVLADQILNESSASSDGKAAIMNRRSTEKNARVVRSADSEATVSQEEEDWAQSSREAAREAAERARSEARKFARETAARSRQEARERARKAGRNDSETAPGTYTTQENFTDPFADSGRENKSRSSSFFGDFTRGFSESFGHDFVKSTKDFSKTFSENIKDVISSVSSSLDSLKTSFGSDLSGDMETISFPSEEEICGVQVQVLAADVEVCASCSENAAVHYDSAIPDLDVVCRGGVLSVIQNTSETSHIGRNLSIQIEIPTHCNPALQVVSKLGDIHIENVLTMDCELRSRAGDIELNGERCSGNLKVSTLEDISIQLQKVEGNVELQATSGDIEMQTDTVNGMVSTKTLSGDTNLKTGTVNGNLNVTSASGDIKVSVINCQGDTVCYSASGDMDCRVGNGSGNCSLQSASGEISGRAGSLLGDLMLKTVSGDQHFSLCGLQGNIRLHTTSGDIHFEAPDPSAFQVELKTRSGSVYTNLAGGSGSGQFRRGNGPQELSVSSVSGDINIEFA